MRRMKLLDRHSWQKGHVAAALLALVAALLIAFTLQGVAWADPEAEGSSQSQTVVNYDDVPYGEANKNEVVYIKGDASGAVTGLYVVNEFNTDEQMRVLDPGKYTAITNLSTAQPLEQAQGNVSVVTLAGEPTYYQGTMETTTKLPWAITVRYSLDGKDVSPEDLAGQSGELDITLDVTALSDSDVSAFSDSYVLQAQGTFDNQSFTLDEAEDATVAHVGGSTTVAYMVLPGESGTYHVTGDAKDFEYSGWQITAMPLSLAIDLADQDTSGLNDAAGELEDATSQLADGAQDLTDGLKDLSKGAQSASEGASALNQGAQELASYTGELESGASQLASGLQALESGLDAGIEEAAAGAAGAEAAQQAYVAAYTKLKTLLATDPTNVEAINQAADEMHAAAQQLAQTSGAAGAYQALSELKNQGVGDLVSGASNLEAGAAAINEGAQALAQGSDSLSQGLDSLASGSFSAYEGARQLTAGNEALADAVSGIDDKILDELQKAIDEKLGSDFTPHSFVVPSNTKVDSVQFVYVFDGIEIPEEEAAPEEPEEEKTIIDRFFDLFA